MSEDGYLKAIEKKNQKVPLRLADHLFCKMTHAKEEFRILKGMF
jgi:hypothetical protein